MDDITIERPDFISPELWSYLPAFPFEYPWPCAILPLPRFILEMWCPITPPGAQFRVSNLVIAPSEVQIGSPVLISCTAENIGTEAGDYTAKLRGDFIAEQTITLQPGESRVVSFEVVPQVAKSYSVTVNGLHGSFLATTAPVADIRVENLVISPSEVMVGETVSISVVAKNYGTATGTKRIVCTIS